MSVHQDLSEDEKTTLAEKYCPLLVLFPEIGSDNSGKNKRKDHYRPKNANSSQSPLDQDYHPRNIDHILDNIRVPKRIANKGPEVIHEHVLADMSEKKLKYINLLDRGSPKNRDKYWDRYREIKDGYPRTAYVNIVKGSGRYEDFISIQYWMAYFFNDWHTRHEVDWEMVSVILKKDAFSKEPEEPIVCVYDAHMNSYVMPWEKVEKVKGAEDKQPDRNGSHPVVYVARGSHASYFYDYPSSFNVASPLLSANWMKIIRNLWQAERYKDHVMSFENGERHLLKNLEIIPKPVPFMPQQSPHSLIGKILHKIGKSLHIIPSPPNVSYRWDGNWRWLNFEGRWGSAPWIWRFFDFFYRSRILRGFTIFQIFQRLTFLRKRPYLEAGPYGPSRHGLCWTDPFDWVNLKCYDAHIQDNWIGKGCNKHRRKVYEDLS